jgi:hypothetical protein
VRGGQIIQKGLGQFADGGTRDRESPTVLQFFLNFRILPVPPEASQADFEDQVKGVVSLGRNPLSVKLRPLDLAAADALLVDQANPRLSQRKP